MTKYKFAKEIEDFLNVLKDAGGFGIEDMEPIEARNLDLIEQESPEVKGVVEIGADGPFGPIPMYDYTPIGAPENKALPAIIFYHGGGWVIGSRDGHDSLCRYLSKKSKPAQIDADQGQTKISECASDMQHGAVASDHNADINGFWQGLAGLLNSYPGDLAGRGIAEKHSQTAAFKERLQ